MKINDLGGGVIGFVESSVKFMQHFPCNWDVISFIIERIVTNTLILKIIRIIMLRILYYLLILTLFSVSKASFALKVDAHIWVGQQVINDLAYDGKLTFDLNGQEIKIAPTIEVVNAILTNQSAFLMGNIGPDAVPDILIGQMLIHPGVKDTEDNNIGWQTDAWLQHLLKNQGINDTGKAFTYGFLGHAAVDVFAHTYVNQYAGDVFALYDEQLVEKRHFTLEGYISNHLPPLTNHLGQPLNKKPWQLITLDNTYAEFARDVLVYNEEVQEQYNKVPKSAGHLIGYYEYRNAVKAIAEDPIWGAIDAAILQAIAEYYDIELTSGEAESIVNELQRNLDRLNRIGEDVQVLNNQIYDNARKLDNAVNTAVDNMQTAEIRVINKQREWRDKLLSVQSLPSCPKIIYMKCKWYGCWPATKDDPICNAAKKAIEESNRLILNLANSLEDQLLGLKDDLIDQNQDLHREVNRAADSLKEIENGIIDLGQMLTANTSPIKSILDGWLKDIDIAMTAYVKASSKSIINTINPDPEVSALDPLELWFKCYHQSIIGIPSSLSSCKGLISGVQKLFTSLDSINSAVIKIGIPGAEQISKLKNKTINNLTDKLKAKVKDKVIDMLPEEVQDILALQKVYINDAVLNDYFSRAETVIPAKGLIMIPDMAERVKADMHLTDDGKLDPSKFAMIYNAVVLAKLAILDRYAFETLAVSSGSSDYTNYAYQIENVVAQAFGNIDGNHQWMLIPPPLPNTLNSYPAVNYTYSSDRSALGESGGLGFVLWKGDMRDTMFRKLFIGPLSPGIDLPSSINKSTLIDSSYPYQVCSNNPFPDDIDDKSCIASWLIPIITMMLN